jgi:predicted patatin/cPLA2 family phospholipase
MVESGLYAGHPRADLVNAALRHPVVELLKARSQVDGQGSATTDDAILGLAIEGGGTRGVIAAGMVTALECLNLTRVFDVVVGSSAGAFTAAYFVAEQAQFGTTIYYDDLPSGFLRVRLTSLLSGTVLDMDYVMEGVLKHQKRLDVEQILQAKAALGVVVSDIEERRSVLIKEFLGPQDLLDALRGSAALPVLSGPPVIYRGMLVTDGGLYQPFPYRSAIEMGCTHVLVLTTRLTELTPPRSHLSDWLASQYLRKHPSLGRDIVDRHKTYRQELKVIHDRTLDHEGPPYICNVAPASGVVGRLETDRRPLVDAAIAGFQSMYEVLGLEVPRVIEVLKPFESK